MSKICPGCSAELSDAARFCTKCGYMLEEEVMPVLSTEDRTAAEQKAPEDEMCGFYPSEQRFSVQPDLQQEMPANPGISKEIVKSMKEQLKAAKRAEKAARKAAKNSNNTKTSVLGLVCAVVLSGFLVINLVACFMFSLILGLAGSDISNFAIGIGKDMLSVDTLLESVEAFSNEDVRELVEELISEGADLTVSAGGESYTIEFSEETMGIMESLVLSDSGPAGMLAETIDEYMGVLSTAAVLIIVYIAVNITVLVVAIAVCLGMGKRGLVVPGIIFAVIGCITLIISLIGMMLPDIISALGINSLFSLDFVVKCTLTSSIVTALFGALLCLVGTLEKSK